MKSVRENTKERIKYGDKVLLQGTFIKEFDNGNIRVSFSPELDKREFPIFEINIPKDSLSTTLKPSWTSEELDKVLPQLRIKHEKRCGWGKGTGGCTCGMMTHNQAIIECKQALLGQGGEK
jgi:hypothetical protein